MYILPSILIIVSILFFIYCDGPTEAIGLIYMKIRTTIQRPEMWQTVGGSSSSSNSDGPTERSKGHDPDRERTYDWSRQLGRFTAKKDEIQKSVPSFARGEKGCPFY